MSLSYEFAGANNDCCLCLHSIYTFIEFTKQFVHFNVINYTYSHTNQFC